MDCLRHSDYYLKTTSTMPTSLLILLLLLQLLLLPPPLLTLCISFFGDTIGLAGSPYLIHVGGVTGRGDKDLAAAEMKLHKEGMDWVPTVFEWLVWMQHISRKLT